MSRHRHRQHDTKKPTRSESVLAGLLVLSVIGNLTFITLWCSEKKSAESYRERWLSTPYGGYCERIGNHLEAWTKRSEESINGIKAKVEWLCENSGKTESK